jgi:small-conductance mechanosensitive channel
MPWWATRLLGTAATLTAAYLVGRILRGVILAKIVRLAARTTGAWDDIVVDEIRCRVLLWSLLIGVWLSLGHWAVRADVRGLTTKVLIAIAGASITFMAAAIANRLLVAYSARLTSVVRVSGLTQNVTRILVTIVGALVILDGLGLNITPMLTALGVGGLAVALALQEPLSNLFAGLAISIAGHIRIGDYVKLDSGQEGVITDFDWRSTRILTLANNVVVVPNAALAKSIVTNHSLPVPLNNVAVQVFVAHGSNLELVERLALEVAREVQQQVSGAVRAFEPSVRFQTFGEAGIGLAVSLQGQQFADQGLLRHELVKRLQARFNREGIAMPQPPRMIAARN